MTPSAQRASWMFIVYTRFERARVIGARALQISSGAPPLVSTIDGAPDPMEIATREFEASMLPVLVQRSADARHR